MTYNTNIRYFELKKQTNKKKKVRRQSKNAEWICSFQRQISDTSPRREMLAQNNCLARTDSPSMVSADSSYQQANAGLGQA